jgi:hypothetical protein
MLYERRLLFAHPRAFASWRTASNRVLNFLTPTMSPNITAPGHKYSCELEKWRLEHKRRPSETYRGKGSTERLFAKYQNNIDPEYVLEF